MTQIQIVNASTIDDRPFSLSIEGFVGQNALYGTLEGVSFDGTSTAYFSLTANQKRKLNDMLTDILPASWDGKYNQAEIDEVLKDGPLLFKV